jgi:hypothetical protein
MDASGAGPASPPPRHPSSASGGVVVDHEGRRLRGGGPATQARPACAKVCYGMLLFTRDDVQAGRDPVRCAGPCMRCCMVCLLRRSRGGAPSRPAQRCWGVHLRRDSALPPPSADNAPLAVAGPFRFTCTGKAVHALREGPPPAPGAKVLLPYCEGLEARARGWRAAACGGAACGDARRSSAPCALEAPARGGAG